MGESIPWPWNGQLHQASPLLRSGDSPTVRGIHENCPKIKLQYVLFAEKSCRIAKINSELAMTEQSWLLLAFFAIIRPDQDWFWWPTFSFIASQSGWLNRRPWVRHHNSKINLHSAIMNSHFLFNHQKCEWCLKPWFQQCDSHQN